jgi:6-phosphogluconolactonase (cycloisomerase 2 family)
MIKPVVMKKIATLLILLAFAGNLISQINYVNHIKATNAGECEVSHNGKFLYLTCLEGLVVYEINQKTGGLTKKQTIQGADQLELSSPHISPDDKFLYVQSFVRNPDEINSVIRTYSCNAQTGELKLVNTIADQNGNRIEFGANIQLSPKGNLLFITNNSHQELLIYKRNVSSGGLSYLNTTSTETISMFSDIAMSPDERFLYVFSPNIHKACHVYEVDQRTGEINKIQDVENPNYRHYTSHDFLISPDGRNAYTIGTDVYAANQTQPQIGQYKRDVSTGMLSFEHNYDNLQSCGIRDLSFLYMDGSGDNLFATTSYGDEVHGVHIFKRSPSSGDIAFQKSILDKAPTDKLRGAFWMAFGKDNRFIYLTASRDHALHIVENANSHASIIPIEAGVGSPSSYDPEDDLGFDQPVIAQENDNEENFPVPPSDEREDEMTSIHRKLQAETSDTRRLDLSYALLEGKKLKIIQVASMAMLFKSEYKRLEFVKFASYFVDDPQYLKILEDLFTYESIRKDYNKHVTNLKD